MKPILYIIIPVLNEASNCKNLMLDVQEIDKNVQNEYVTNIIVVDDGSIDETSEKLKEYSNGLYLKILVHKQNQGPGAAFGTAFKYLEQLLQPDDWVATMEGDNTSHIQTLLQMLTRRKEGYDVVLASVYSYGGRFDGVRWWRLALSHVANELVEVALRLYGLRTLSSFFRLHSGNSILMLQNIFGPRIVENSGFGWALEMLYKMVLLNFKISEVETSVDWLKRNGISKMRTFRTIREYLNIIITHRKWLVGLQNSKLMDKDAHNENI